MPRKQIIVISDAKDEHLQPVVSRLTSPYTIIGPRDGELVDELSYSPTKDAELRCIFNGKPIDIASVKSVWFRKPTRALGLMPVEEKYKSYCRTAVTTLIHTLNAQFQHAFWISRYEAIRRTDDKPFQQLMATRLGFNVPVTLYTSDAKRARAFIASQPATIIKSLTQEPPVYKQSLDRGFTATFSRRITPKDPIDLTGLHLAPAIFQQAIDAALDLRVTIVGTKVFAASIHAPTPTDSKYQQIRDWRFLELGGTTFERYKLPKQIERLCVEYVKSLGLQYGAMDLVVDKRGKIWFLENNPNGQWLFIEEQTKMPIADTLASLLERGNGD